MGTIVGSIIGALAFVALAGAVAYYFMIYKKKLDKKIIPTKDDQQDFEIETDAV